MDCSALVLKGCNVGDFFLGLEVTYHLGERLLHMLSVLFRKSALSFIQ